eukprot:Nitzschia sp. Nitz4//scaffold62_size106224//43427//44701//NITZ4_004354-RA/size106224-processed-gene-0.30-mRNA-1//1//CDS//3329555850//4866//frame0
MFLLVLPHKLCTSFLLLCLAVLQCLVSKAQAEIDPSATNAFGSPASDDSFVHCDIFLAPSSSMGWGVFAARDFERGEIVEIVPAYLSLPSTGVEIQSSILYDYVHTTGCSSSALDMENDEEPSMDQLLLGLGSSYNHHSSPNIAFMEYAKPKGHLMTVQAIRNISKGEELLARYGDNDWFQARGIQQQSLPPKQVSISPVDIPFYQQKYCSRVQAGVGNQTWYERILPHIQRVDFTLRQELAKWDAGLGYVRARYDLQPGDRIELSLGLLVSQRILADSAVAPLVVGWEALDSVQQRSLRNLRKRYRDQFVVHYPGQGKRYDVFESYEDLGILPIGAISLVRRRGRSQEDSNCKLKIRETMQPGSGSLALELVATKPISKGQVLLLDMAPAGTPQELQMLQDLWKRTGQPYHAVTFLRDEHDEL